MAFGQGGIFNVTITCVTQDLCFEGLGRLFLGLGRLFLGLGRRFLGLGRWFLGLGPPFLRFIQSTVHQIFAFYMHVKEGVLRTYSNPDSQGNRNICKLNWHRIEDKKHE